jgi:hypothetical protein
MGYKLVRLVGFCLLTVLGLNTSYIFVSLAGTEMSTIGAIWWFSLTVLLVLATVVSSVGIIRTIAEV